jgi:hypothetical protein
MNIGMPGAVGGSIIEASPLLNSFTASPPGTKVSPRKKCNQSPDQTSALLRSGGWGQGRVRNPSRLNRYLPASLRTGKDCQLKYHKLRENAQRSALSPVFESR